MAVAGSFVVRAAAAAFTLFAFVAPVSAQTPVHKLAPLEVRAGSRISPELPLATRALSALNADAIALQPVRTVQDAIASLLGVDVQARSAAQADVSLRAGSYEQVLVLVDGMRMSDAQTGHFDLNVAVPLHDVERIEVLRGPGSAVHGADAFGGVINIVTRRAERTSAVLRAEGGSFGTFGISAGAQLNGSRVRGAASVEHRRSDGHRPGTDYDVTSGSATLETPLAGRPLRARFGAEHRAFGAANFYTSPAARFDEFETTSSFSGVLAWLAPVEAAFSIEPRVSVRRHNDEFLLRRTDPAFYRNEHHTWQLGGELTARYSASVVRIAAGGEAYGDMLESSSLGDREEKRAAGFIEASTGRPGRAVLTTGVRTDWHSAFGTFVSPSAAAAVWLTPALRVRGSAGRAFRAPTFTERYYRDPANIGDPALDVERGWEAELGTELAVRGATLSVSGFTRATKSLIDWVKPADSASAPWRTMNIQAAEFHGLELALTDVVLVGTRLGARASLVDVDADRDDGLRSKYALRPLTRQLSGDVARNVLGFELFLRASHARRATEADGYTLLDARVGRTIGPLRLSIDATNLADESFLDVSGVHGAGTALSAGLEWRTGGGR